MKNAHPRRPSLLVLVGLLLLGSLVLGLFTARLADSARTPLDLARGLVRSGRFAEAEGEYLAAARLRPPSLPVFIELLDNHERILIRMGRTVPAGARAFPLDEEPITSAITASDLPMDTVFLAGWWRRTSRGEATAADRVRVLASANAEPPAPWANHLLGRVEADDGHDDEAAERFAREAGFFADRREDAEAACEEWMSGERWDRLGRALSNPRFARQVRAIIRMQESLARRDWRGIARWFFPAQYEGTSLGVAVLTIVSALTWFGICAQIGRVWERPKLRIPLYLGALCLGVLSTYLTLALAIVEHAYGFSEKKQPLPDAIYFVVGVGLREELSKALMLLPLVPFLKRWGHRREALACGALVGLGFAAEENIAYLHMGLATALARFLTANFLHVSTTGLVAVAVDDYARGSSQRESDLGGLSHTLMVVIAAHGLYDFFLSSSLVEDSSYLSMFVFILLTRRFIAVLRALPGREGSLLRHFCLGLAALAGASFVYACTLVGPKDAFVALAEGGLGLVIVTVMFVQELRTVSS